MSALTTLLEQLSQLNLTGMQAVPQSLQEAVKVLTPAESKEEEERKMRSAEDKLRDRKGKFETATAFTHTLMEEVGRRWGGGGGSGG